MSLSAFMKLYVQEILCCMPLGCCLTVGRFKEYTKHIHKGYQREMLNGDVCFLPNGVGQWGVVQLQGSLYQCGGDTDCKNSDLTILPDTCQSKIPSWN